MWNTSNLVSDANLGMLSTARAFLIMEKRRRIVGCEKDGGTAEKLMKGLAEVHVCYLLKGK